MSLTMFASGFPTVVLGSGVGYPSSLRPTSRSTLLRVLGKGRSYSPAMRATPIAITKTYVALLVSLY